MTANVSVMIDHREGVLKIPNAALRFRPESAKQGRLPEKGSESSTSLVGLLIERIDKRIQPDTGSAVETRNGFEIIKAGISGN